MEEVHDIYGKNVTGKGVPVSFYRSWRLNHYRQHTLLSNYPGLASPAIHVNLFLNPLTKGIISENPLITDPLFLFKVFSLLLNTIFPLLIQYQFNTNSIPNQYQVNS